MPVNARKPLFLALILLVAVGLIAGYRHAAAVRKATQTATLSKNAAPPCAVSDFPQAFDGTVGLPWRAVTLYLETVPIGQERDVCVELTPEKAPAADLLIPERLMAGSSAPNCKRRQLRVLGDGDQQRRVFVRFRYVAAGPAGEDRQRVHLLAADNTVVGEVTVVANQTATEDGVTP